MRYFVPDIRVAEEAPTCIERLSGVPWGLPKERWPKCSQCGGHQSLIAQFQHHADRLDLGREGRMLFVFHCEKDPGMCDDWEPFSGGNACFVVEPENLQHGETAIPAGGLPIEHSVRVVNWIERDDGLPATLTDYFRNDAQHLGLPEEVHAQVKWGSRLGGFPNWMQSAEEAPQGWDFVAQLDSSYSFYSPPAQSQPWISDDPEKFEGRTHIGKGPNFGFGLGYVLLRRRANDVPEGCFFWQR